jgi:hypothetical protein
LGWPATRRRHRWGRTGAGGGSRGGAAAAPRPCCSAAAVRHGWPRHNAPPPLAAHRLVAAPPRLCSIRHRLATALLGPRPTSGPAPLGPRPASALPAAALHYAGRRPPLHRIFASIPPPSSLSGLLRRAMGPPRLSPLSPAAPAPVEGKGEPPPPRWPPRAKGKSLAAAKSRLGSRGMERMRRGRGRKRMEREEGVGGVNHRV